MTGLISGVEQPSGGGTGPTGPLGSEGTAHRCFFEPEPRSNAGWFADRVGLTPANVAVLKNGRAKAVRFSTLAAMCRVLGCQPGDLLEWVEDGAEAPRAPHEASR